MRGNVFGHESKMKWNFGYLGLTIFTYIFIYVHMSSPQYTFFNEWINGMSHSERYFIYLWGKTAEICFF